MNWKVFREKIKLLPHDNADSLEIAKIGTYQAVVQKGLYQDGECVIFIPEKSLLSGDLQKKFLSYLVGPEQNRVTHVKLRGELSQGVILPDDPRFQSIELGEDLSHLLDIKEFIPPIPVHLSGTVKRMENVPYFQKM